VVRAEGGTDLLRAAAVSLGALGVLSEVTLRCVPAFVLHADERPMRLDEVLDGFDELMAGNDHAEFHWFPNTRVALTKRNNRVPVDDDPLPSWRGWLDDELLANTVYGAVCRVGRTLPALVPAINRLATRTLSARRYTGRSDRVFCSPRRVRFVEMEYALPRAAFREAFAELRRVLARLPFPVAVPVEVRVVAADECWLSTAYRRDSVYLAVHQYVGMPYRPYFAAVEEICTALDGRPHWGKLHGRDAAALRCAYPRLPRFTALRDELDPERRFANGYLRRVLGP
jgi:L-gulonolactone oxidase